MPSSTFSYMGSFAVQQYLLDHSGDVDGVVLTGTAAIDVLEPALDLSQPLDLAMFNTAASLLVPTSTGCPGTRPSSMPA